MEGREGGMGEGGGREGREGRREGGGRERGRKHINLSCILRDGLLTLRYMAGIEWSCGHSCPLPLHHH